MRILFTIFFIALGLNAKSQNESSVFKVRTDTCRYLKAKPNEGNAMKGNPIYVANGVIINPAELDVDLIKEYTIVQCPESFNRFKYVGSQGAIIITTEQVVEVTTPQKILEEQNLKRQVIFGLNSLLLQDTTLKISLKVIDEIEVTNSIDPADNLLKSCINIWTVPKKYREKYFTELL